MIKRRFYSFSTFLIFIVLYSYTTIVLFLLLTFAMLNLKKPIKPIMQYWAKSIFFLIGKRLRILGKENIEKNKKYIIVANHASLFDIVAIMSFYPNVSWFGHERLLQIPLFGKLLRMTDYIPARPASIKNTKQMLDDLTSKAQGLTVVIFPEGTRTLDGYIQDFYRGFVHLLRASEIGVLPVTLNGFFLLKPKNRFHLNLTSKLNVVIHKPIENQELTNKNDREIIQMVKGIIESAYRNASK